MELNIEQFKKCTPLTPVDKLQEILPFLNSTLKKYEINTPMRVSHFLAQVLHESGGFKFSKEIASGEAYEGRRDLGNTQKGDGVKYKGRGYIQITGRFNYESYKMYTGIDFITFPELLESPKHAIDSAGWFWKIKNLNALADKDEFTKITKTINGGTNGIEDRRQYLHKCKDLFGLKYKKP